MTTIISRAELANAIVFFRETHEAIDNMLMTSSNISAFDVAQQYAKDKGPLLTVAMNNIVLITEPEVDEDDEDEECDVITYLDGLNFATVHYQKATAAMLAALGEVEYCSLLDAADYLVSRDKAIITLLSHQTWVSGSTVSAEDRALALNHLSFLLETCQTLQKA